MLYQACYTVPEVLSDFGVCAVGSCWMQPSCKLVYCCKCFIPGILVVIRRFPQQVRAKYIFSVAKLWYVTHAYVPYFFPCCEVLASWYMMGTVRFPCSKRRYRACSPPFRRWKPHRSDYTNTAWRINNVPATQVAKCGIFTTFSFAGLHE